MTEPRRILDDKDRGLDVELLRAARAYRPKASAKRSVLTALGLPTAAAAAVTTSKVAAALGTLKALAATKAGTVVVVIAGVTAVGASAGYVVNTRGAHETHARDTTSLREVVPPTAVPPERAASVVPAVMSAPSLEPSSDPSPEPARPSARAPKAPPSLAVSAAAPAAEDSLADELARLDRVRVAQHAHDGARALAELDGYAARYPHGSLVMEAAVLRIETYAASGDLPTARALASQFLTAHPRNLLANRVRALRASWPPDPVGEDPP